MYRILLIIMIAVLGILLISCSAEKKQEAAGGEQPAMKTMVSDTSMVSCAGCDMQHTKAEMVAHEIDGETKHFCSDACKDNYVAKVEKEKSAESSKVN